MPITPGTIEARSSTGHVIIGAILFGFLGAAILYADHSTDDPFGIILGPIFLFVCLLSLKILISPIIMFSADQRGITIGKGLVRHTHTLVPWSKVVSINESTMTRLGPKAGSSKGVQKVVVCSIRVEFDESVNLGTYGYAGASPSRNRYSIQPKMFGLGTDGADVVLGLLEMKDKYPKT